MEYREIVAVTGLGGLYQLLATKSDGAIVRNLSDKSTKFISARLHNVTPLESIEVYTTGENVRLHQVFQQMKEKEGSIAIIDPKADNNAVKNYFKSVFPTFDEERVYVSDMKKMVKWYELLKSNELLNFETAPAEGTEAAETATAEASDEEKPAKKAAKTKKAASEEEEGSEEKPAKKARTKKAAEPTAEGEEKPKKTAKKKKVEDE
jgi:hypothetical protein